MSEMKPQNTEQRSSKKEVLKLTTFTVLITALLLIVFETVVKRLYRWCSSKTSRQRLEQVISTHNAIDDYFWEPDESGAMQEATSVFTESKAGSSNIELF